MAQLILSDGSWSTLSLEAGESFGIRYMIPDGVENLVDVEYKDVSKSNYYGFHKITAKQDILLLVEDLYENGHTARHCRFIRADRTSEIPLCHEVLKTCIFPRARRRLHKAGIPSSNFLGGFTMVLGYEDEVAIADYHEGGSHGWIIEKSVLTDLLTEVPQLI